MILILLPSELYIAAVVLITVSLLLICLLLLFWRGCIQCDFCWLMAFSWWLVEKMVNFVWETAILNSCKATSKFIGLYMTSEHCRPHWTAAVQIWICLRFFSYDSRCCDKGRDSEGRRNIPLRLDLVFVTMRTNEQSRHCVFNLLSLPKSHVLNNL